MPINIKFTRLLLNCEACVTRGEPGKLGIKRCQPGFPLINLQVRLLYDVKLYRTSCPLDTIDDVIQKLQRHGDQFKTHVVRKANQVNLQQCNTMRGN